MGLKWFYCSLGTSEPSAFFLSFFFILSQAEVAVGADFWFIYSKILFHGRTDKSPWENYGRIMSSNYCFILNVLEIQILECKTNLDGNGLAATIGVKLYVYVSLKTC